MIGGINIIDAILAGLIVALLVLLAYALIKRPRRF
jgi:hypothetical protein